MYTSLKTRRHYEDRYDSATIDQCRSGEQIVNLTFKEIEKTIPRKELKEKLPGWYLQYSQYYFLFVEMVAAARAENREATIEKWMSDDQLLDDRIASSEMPGGIYCLACGKDMHEISKDYMLRDGRNEDDILFILECTNCAKRKAYWQDGSAWEGARHKCTKCGGETVTKHSKTLKIITWTETCKVCGHVATDSIDLVEPKKKQEPVDPFLELDRKRFIFDSDMMFKFSQKMKHFERIAKLQSSELDKTERPNVYDAIKQVKKLKIVQLKELLEQLFIKNGYSDFKLGDPQIGREFSIDFSCLDTIDDRDEHKSKKVLLKTIERSLEETNWRLMSAGLSYRLGYITGCLRAYESEDDIKKLVEQRIKKGYVPKKASVETTDANQNPKEKFYQRDLRESALVYFDKLTIGSIPAEITLKSGVTKQTSLPVLSGEMNPLLRVIIPIRDNDDTVPKFVKDFDFKFGGSKDCSNLKKDSLGRRVRVKDAQPSKG